MKKYLCTIEVKDWVKLPDGVSRTIAYEQVSAYDDFSARHKAFDQFLNAIEFPSVARSKFQSLGIGLLDICAPESVEI